MKFGKEFASQMVSEWQDAYMNYNSLKTLLKEILIFRRQQSRSPENQVNPRPPPLKATSLKRRGSLFRAFSGLTNQYGNRSPKKDNEDEVILVNAMHTADEEQGEDSRSYRKVFLLSSEEGGQHELAFFSRLDDEFNKVVNFYRAKEEEEVVKDAEELNIQMDALIALRIKVNDPAAVTNQRNTGYPMKVIHEEQQEKRSDNVREYQMASLEVLNHIKINTTAESPLSVIKNMFHGSKSDLHFNKKELRDAKEMLKQAFIEFHEKLRLLKNYVFLNQLAFSKIMKKYDKVTKLIERVESSFVKHFCNGNHHKGMSTLKPNARRQRHQDTFFVGCFFGCSLALLVAIIVNAHARYLLNKGGATRYMNTIFPLYSLFGFLVLHMLMYAANVYYWTQYRVNYSFIFRFKPGTELGYTEVLLLGSGLSVLTLAAALSNLEMELDPSTQSYKTLTELLPLGLVIVVLLITVCPFNIFYRENRFFLLVCLWRCICAPFYAITLADFFLHDQFTSQVQLLRYLQFYVCYYGWGDFKRRNADNCKGGAYDVITIVIAVIPFWIRVLQIIRRGLWNFFRLENEHLNNVGKFRAVKSVPLPFSYENDDKNL
ncbi:hypothetical protein L1987_52391 [Smallanthus sonchifolius]|uniref:Uncharacterized protein n=1 Tax=Smallanthus sonchifolius TaxID=185202 RepID=A0ACB9ETL1_9ASTR|nr:hypothetical protein L1987_52391 [Smallanthus sonchifolius]